MFAPGIAKTQARAAERPVRKPVVQRTIGSTAQATAPTISWDFGKIPVFAPDSGNAPRAGTAPASIRSPYAGLANPAVGARDDPLEHDADRVADRVMQMPVSDGAPRVARQENSSRRGTGPGRDSLVAGSLPASVQEVLSEPGQPLDGPTRAFFEPRFGHDFNHIRVHADGRAAESAQAVAAQAYAAGSHLVFAANRYAPSTRSGARLLAHELAHTLQPQDGNGRPGGVIRRQPTSLGAYPEAERRTLRQSTIPTPMIDDAFLLDVFGTAAQAGGATTTYNFGGTTVFDPAIPAVLQRGLRSTGAYLSDQTNVLPLGSTVTLVLDLSRFKGPNARFRFSHFTHTEAGKPAEIMLIENLGPAPPAIAAVNVPTGSFTVRGQTFTAGPGWNSQQFGGLQAVLNRLPDAVIQEAAGTTFSLRGQGTVDEAGHYDAEHDEIEMHQNAFPSGATTFGGADAGMRSMTHEIGHLLDLRRLERAWRTFHTGGRTAAGQTTLLRERSLSGTRWKAPTGGGNFTQTDARTATANQDFRQAASLDGIRPGRTATDPLSGGPTSYSNTDWQELFAESFSLYVNDPELFRLIRPNLFRYFSTRFPLPAAAATPGGQAGAPAAPPRP